MEIFEQRASTPRGRGRRRAVPWWPEDIPAPEDGPQPDDYYLVVEDIDEQLVVLEAVRWPHLDSKGRLAFDRGGAADPDLDPAAPTVQHDTAELVEVVDEARRRHDQVPRPLRIGDTFWVRATHIGDRLAWRDVIDVTKQARQQARMAQAAAAFGTITPERAEMLAMTRPAAEPDRPEPPLEGGGPAAAGPAV